MKFSRSERKTNKVRATVDLTPLIDVVFQLLIFFMLTAQFVIQNAIQVEMPEAESDAPSIEQRKVAITLAYGKDGPNGAGKVYFEDEEMSSMKQLAGRIEDELDANPDVNVMIRPDARIEARRLIRVLGMATNLGVEEGKLGIAVQPVSEDAE
ncbi:MAG: biopolymer transporter ExbD [bacterium]|nr:biopolymer transporter ExbD [bacterium]